MEKTINISASLAGFHNPTKHKGFTPEQFLLAYLRRQAKKSWNGSKVKNERVGIVILVLRDWGEYIKLVKNLFPRTLKYE